MTVLEKPSAYRTFHYPRNGFSISLYCLIERFFYIRAYSNA